MKKYRKFGAMKIFRHTLTTRVFCLFTGLIFLNMSFFLAEVCMLDIKDKDMIENVCMLVLNGGLEEERDSHSAGSDIPLKILSPSDEHRLLCHSNLFLIAAARHHDTADHYRHANHSQLFSPPPERLTDFS